EKQKFGAFTDLADVAERVALARDRTAVHAQPQAVRSAGILRHPIVVLPHLDAARVVPLHPLPVDGVVPVFRLRQRSGGRVAEFAGAVVAIADAVALQTAPTIVGEAFGVRSFDDLAQNPREVLVVIRAVDAGDVLVLGAVGRAGGHAREP